MRSTDSKNASRKPETEISPAIAVDAKTGEMRDIPPQAPSAVSLVSPEAPLAELTHAIDAFGQRLRYNFGGSRAVLEPQEGQPVGFESKPGESPTAFERAYQEAKRGWKASVATNDLQRKQERDEKIKAAADLNRRKGDQKP